MAQAKTGIQMYGLCILLLNHGNVCDTVIH